MSVIGKLLGLANKLDRNGFYNEASAIDEILKLAIDEYTIPVDPSDIWGEPSITLPTEQPDDLNEQKEKMREYIKTKQKESEELEVKLPKLQLEHFKNIGINMELISDLVEILSMLGTPQIRKDVEPILTNKTFNTFSTALSISADINKKWVEYGEKLLDDMGFTVQPKHGVITKKYRIRGGLATVGLQYLSKTIVILFIDIKMSDEEQVRNYYESIKNVISNVAGQ